MSGERAECVCAMVGVGAGNRLRAVCRIRYSVGSDGPGQVLSGPTCGPDKVRSKNNSQIRYTWAKSGLERRSGFCSLDVLLRMAISRQKDVVLQFFFGDGVPMSLPIDVHEKNVAKSVKMACFAVFAFLANFVPFLGEILEGIPFLGHCSKKNSL